MSRHLYALMPGRDAREMTFLEPGRSTPLGLSDVRTGDRVVVFAPGREVMATSATLSARNEAEARQSAPFAIEDDLASAAESTHVAIGPKGSPGTPRALYAASAALMEDWIARLEGLGLEAAQIIPEQSVLPENVRVNCGSHILARDEDAPFVVDLSLPPTLQAALLGEQPLPAVELDGGLARLASYAEATSAPVDLRQGAYRARRAMSFGDMSRLRITAALAVAVAVVWIGVQWLEVRAMDAEALRLRADAYQRYRQAYPDAPTSVDPVRAIRANTAATGSGTELDFLSVTAALYAGVAEIEGAQLTALRFDPDRGGMTAVVAYPDFGDDAELKAALEQLGLVARVGDSRQVNRVVMGDVFVEGLQ